MDQNIANIKEVASQDLTKSSVAHDVRLLTAGLPAPEWLDPRDLRCFSEKPPSLFFFLPKCTCLHLLRAGVLLFEYQGDVKAQD